MNFIISTSKISTSKSNIKNFFLKILPCEMVMLLTEGFSQFEAQFYTSSSVDNDALLCLKIFDRT